MIGAFQFPYLRYLHCISVWIERCVDRSATRPPSPCSRQQLHTNARQTRVQSSPSLEVGIRLVINKRDCRPFPPLWSIGIGRDGSNRAIRGPQTLQSVWILRPWPTIAGYPSASGPDTTTETIRARVMQIRPGRTPGFVAAPWGLGPFRASAWGVLSLKHTWPPLGALGRPNRLPLARSIERVTTTTRQQAPLLVFGDQNSSVVSKASSLAAPRAQASKLTRQCTLFKRHRHDHGSSSTRDRRLKALVGRAGVGGGPGSRAGETGGQGCVPQQQGRRPRTHGRAQLTT